MTHIWIFQIDRSCTVETGNENFGGGLDGQHGSVSKEQREEGVSRCLDQSAFGDDIMHADRRGGAIGHDDLSRVATGFFDADFAGGLLRAPKRYGKKQKNQDRG